ncbi:MAG: hypothetical protein ACI9R3_004312 [Verrucomicrobiales bacterium]
MYAVGVDGTCNFPGVEKDIAQEAIVAVHSAPISKSTGDIECFAKAVLLVKEMAAQQIAAESRVFSILQPPGNSHRRFVVLRVSCRASRSDVLPGLILW